MIRFIFPSPRRSRDGLTGGGGGGSSSVMSAWKSSFWYLAQKSSRYAGLREGQVAEGFSFTASSGGSSSTSIRGQISCQMPLARSE